MTMMMAMMITTIILKIIITEKENRNKKCHSWDAAKKEFGTLLMMAREKLSVKEM
jgi:hypothetical protein